MATIGGSAVGGELSQTVAASAARTAAFTSDDFVVPYAKGAHFVINVSAITDTPVLTPIIEGKDPISGNYYTILQGANITTVSTTVLKVYPGITASANAAVSDILPRTWRVRITVGDTDSATYSIAASLAP